MVRDEGLTFEWLASVYSRFLLQEACQFINVLIFKDLWDFISHEIS